MTNAIRRPADGNAHTMSITIDLKRRSPTVPERKDIVEFSSAGQFVELLTKAKTDAFLINTDEMEYGGKMTDLKESAQAVRRAYKLGGDPPACIQKDIILHPVQVD